MNAEIMKALGLGGYVKDVESGKCPSCNMPIALTSFRNAISLKEFRISGLCQECQDKVFGC